MLVCATSGGCVVQSVLPSSGPSRDTVVGESRSEIEVVQVTGAIAADLALRMRRQLFSETLGSGEDIRYTIDRSSGKSDSERMEKVSTRWATCPSTKR